MLISQAMAQTVSVPSAPPAPQAPSAGSAAIMNIGMIVVMVAFFYLLLIRPQQQRMKEHAQMLSALKKGDKVVTGGGLVGKISKISADSDEVEIDLGGVKVTALRSTLQGKNEALLKDKK